MSVHQEIVQLQAEREPLQKEIASISSLLSPLYAEKKNLVEKTKAFSTRHSSLAKTLLEQTQQKINALDEQISEAEKRKENLKKQFEANQRKILEMADDPTLYIEEQTSIMISMFLEYLGNHLEEIGSQIKKRYTVTEITQLYDGYFVPSGNFGIYGASDSHIVVQSNDFSLPNTYLFTIHFDSIKYGYRIVCKISDWYANYRHRFTSRLLEELEKNFSYGEYFKLTIEDSSFTLELL